MRVKYMAKIAYMRKYKHVVLSFLNYIYIG